MKTRHYKPEEILGLLPLLGSIAREMEERSAALARVEKRLDELALERGGERSTEHFDLVAEAATHRKELRLARKELDRLGCSVIGTRPLTFRIPELDGAEQRSFVWRSGEPVLK